MPVGPARKPANTTRYPGARWFFSIVKMNKGGIGVMRGPVSENSTAAATGQMRAVPGDALIRRRRAESGPRVSRERA